MRESIPTYAGKYHQIYYARILTGLIGYYFAWPSYHLPILLSCIKFYVYDIDMSPIFVGEADNRSDMQWTHALCTPLWN